MYKSMYKSVMLAAFIGLILILLMTDHVDALSANATDEQLRIMNELEGSDMTIGEYMQKVWPEFYAELDDEQKEKINNWKKSWPDNTKSVGKQENNEEKTDEIKAENTGTASLLTANAAKGVNIIGYGIIPLRISCPATAYCVLAAKHLYF